MTRIAVIVQARTGSTRLPRKVLLDIEGQTALRRVLDRCAAIPGIDQVCCATTDHGLDDPVADLAASLGYPVFRGSEHDVCDRYLGAARMLGADVVMRVTSDCPLIDPTVCGEVLALLRHSGAGYACNNLESLWPHGLDCEAFPTSVLEQAAAKGLLPEEREHVTEWMRNSGEIVCVNLPGPGGDATGYRLTLDYPEDLAMFRALFRLLPPPPHIATLAEILAALRSHPEVAAINARHHK